MADELSNVIAQLGNFATSPQMPVLAGQLGSAAMGRNQNSWQANVGRVASGFGQSAIAAGEATAQEEKSKRDAAFMQQILPYLLAGGPQTEPGVKGETTKKLEFKPDGSYTVKIDGNAITTGENAPAGTPQTNVPGQSQAPAQAPQQPVRAPGVNPRLLPF